MAGSSIKKRPYSEKSKGPRPSKKQRQAAAYHSSSESEEGESDNDKGAPLPAGLFDSDNDDLESMVADDGAPSSEEEGYSGDSSASEDGERKPNKTKKPLKSKSKSEKNSKMSQSKEGNFSARDAPPSSSEDEAQQPDSDVDMSASDEEEEDDDPFSQSSKPSTKSKRNDPEAFATSISKMLSTKLPLSKRADPIVARSAESAAAARQIVDSALEAKARKRLREQKRLALEKGRVRNVLMPSTSRTLNIATGEIEEKPLSEDTTTGQLLATEKRLNKIAQRGVVKLFNAVRAAQVKAAQAQVLARQEGIVGTKRREEKVTEMSRQGFLELIASGGGGLKKGGLEEA